MKLIRKNGSTSNKIRVFLPDSSSTTGAGKTGLGIASAGLIISTIADNEATATTYTAAGSTIETITTLGTFAAPTATKCRFKEVDSTNFPGVYEIQIADARFAVSSAKSLIVSILATGVVPTFAEIDQDPGTIISNIETRLGTSANFDTVAEAVDAISDDTQTLIGLLDTEIATINSTLSTVNSKLGSITGSGANTVLGYFQAVCRNNATLPSDLGGTYAVATHSLQALASAIDTVDNFVDTEIATLQTTLNTINTKLGAVVGFDDFGEQFAAIYDDGQTLIIEIAKVVAEIVDTTYNTFTAHQLLRIAAAGAAGKTTGAQSGSETFYDVQGTIVAFVVTITSNNRAVVNYFP